MRTRTRQGAAALLAAGALLGRLAGSGRFSLVVAAGPGAAVAPALPTKDPDRGNQPAKDGKKPNTVLVLRDNLGYGEVGCYGGGILRGAPTPRIEKLASE
jgi:arylsulfatase